MCQTNFRLNFRTTAHQSRCFALPLLASLLFAYILADPLYPTILANGVPLFYPHLSTLPAAAPSFRLVSGLYKLSRLWSYRDRLKIFAKFAMHHGAPCSLFRNRLHPHISCPVPWERRIFLKTVGVRHYNLHSPDPLFFASRRLSPASVSLALTPLPLGVVYGDFYRLRVKSGRRNMFEIFSRKSATLVTAESYERVCSGSCRTGFRGRPFFLAWGFLPPDTARKTIFLHDEPRFAKHQWQLQPISETERREATNVFSQALWAIQNRRSGEGAGCLSVDGMNAGPG